MRPDGIAPRPMPEVGGAVTLSSAELRKAISQANDATIELTGTRSAWAGATDEPRQALGLREATQTYLDMQDAWFDELGVYIEVLSLVHDGLERAADSYEDSEYVAAQALAREL
ncbi:hypothetical protein ACGFIR_25350 [Micromonospora sp. NPDC049051]|uniref:hypothetical protein n=1 Tax=unclassified Micromonospora TaxID=2617518 RepID=UPI00371C3A31